MELGGWMIRLWVLSVLVGIGVLRFVSIWGGLFLIVYRLLSFFSLVEVKVFIVEWYWWVFLMGCFFI